MNCFPRFVCLLLLLTVSPAVPGGTVSHGFTVSSDIPDGSSTGLLNVQPLTAPSEPYVAQVSVGLSIVPTPGESSFLGDLYAYLEHNGVIAVLLNRPGRRDSELAGYDDDQSISVTFEDGAPDVHNYRPDANTPLGSPLSGTWGPDGRATDPADVVATDGRSLLLSGFLGKPIAGDWSLFVADLSGGGQHRLASWSLTFTTTMVPEPQAYWASGTLLLAWIAWRRANRRKR